MSNDSNIEWTDATWNPVVGCTRVSAGCDNCYAVPMTHRLGAMAMTGDQNLGRKQHYAGLTVLNNRGDRHFNGTVRCVEEALEIPLRWKQPRRIFVNSMSDLFHRDVPFEFVERVFAVMLLCPQHTFQVLTKRPERMRQYLSEFYVSNRIALAAARARRDLLGLSDDFGFAWPLPNVWLGTSCENQAAADERIPHLLRCPAAVRFLSCEPLLGPITLDKGPGEFIRCARCGYTRRDVGEQMDHGLCKGDGPGVHWVIVGGESGAKSRPCNVEWIRSIVRQCRDAAVPCFVKQLGSRPVEAAYHSPGFPDGAMKRLERVSRKGGDPGEWPKDLCVREWPKVGGDR